MARMSYTDKAKLADPIIRELLSIVPDAQQDQALFLAAQIFMKGMQCNTRPMNATCKKNAISAAFSKMPDITFRIGSRTWQGKSYSTVEIDVVNYKPDLSKYQDEGDDE